MPKLKSFSQLQKQITVTDWACLTTGLQISYVTGGNDHTLLANGEQSASLLKAIGAIEDYIQQQDRIDVSVAMQADGYESFHWMEFGAMALHLDLSETDALRIVTIVEDQKQINAWLKNHSQTQKIA